MNSIVERFPGRSGIWNVIQSRLESDRTLYLCGIVFLASRLLVILFVPAEPWSDALWYYTRATEIADRWVYEENGLPTTYWPIGYPGMLGVWFHLTNSSVLSGQILNLICACISFWLLHEITRGMTGSLVAARISVILLTLYPNNLAYTSLLLSETLYLTNILGICYLLMPTAEGRHSKIKLLLAGVLGGTAILTKAQSILLIPILAIVWTMNGLTMRSVPTALMKTALVVAVSIAVVLPWTMRNYNVFNAFILVSSNGGTSLLVGNNNSVVFDYQSDFSESDPLFKEARFSAADQINADKRARALAISWIKENPDKFVMAIPKKVFRLWARDGEGEWGFQANAEFYEDHKMYFRTLRWFNQAFYIFLLVGGALAVKQILARSNTNPRVLFGYLFLLWTTALCIVFSGQSRYHFPVMPFLMMYTALWCAGIIHRHGGKIGDKENRYY